MATLFQDKRTGIWYINYSISQNRFKQSTGLKDRKLAEIRFKEFQVKLFKGEIGAKPLAGKKTTISEFFSKFIEYFDNKNPVDKHSDLARLRAWKDYFLKENVTYVNNISIMQVDEFMTNKIGDRKPRTKKNYFTILKTALNKAEEWELIDKNPIGKKRPPKAPTTFNYFDENEVKKLLEAADKPLKTGIQLLVYTGMRNAELFNLRCRDVDLKRKKIRVWPYENFIPKGKTPRTIPIAPKLSPIIAKLLKEKSPDDYVFRPFEHEHRLYKRFKHLLKSLKMKGTLHDLRHTFATHMAMNGTPIPTLKDYLGHTTIATTNIYAHFAPGKYQGEIEKLNFEPAG